MDSTGDDDMDGTDNTGDNGDMAGGMDGSAADNDGMVDRGDKDSLAVRPSDLGLDPVDKVSLHSPINMPPDIKNLSLHR